MSNITDPLNIETPLVQSHPEVIFQRMGNQMVLLHLRTDRFYELNHTAARIWELLSQGHDLPFIQETLLVEFNVEADQVSAELEALLDLLRDEHLILNVKPMGALRGVSQ